MQFRFHCTTVKQQHSRGMLRRSRHVLSDLGACYTLNFSVAGCECIHLTRVHVHCCTGILLMFAYCMDTDARVDLIV